jgi:hypothetical protein
MALTLRESLLDPDIGPEAICASKKVGWLTLHRETHMRVRGAGVVFKSRLS